MNEHSTLLKTFGIMWIHNSVELQLFVGIFMQNSYLQTNILYWRNYTFFLLLSSF